MKCAINTLSTDFSFKNKLFNRKKSRLLVSAAAASAPVTVGPRQLQPVACVAVSNITRELLRRSLPKTRLSRCSIKVPSQMLAPMRYRSLPKHAVACQVRSPVILTGRMKTDSNGRENPSSLRKWEWKQDIRVIKIDRKRKIYLNILLLNHHWSLMNITLHIFLRKLFFEKKYNQCFMLSMIKS